MKAFQKPLSISQEKYYLQKYQEGDSQAKNILIEHNLRLVAHVVKKYQGTGEDTDDLISIGTIGLIKAVTTFNPQKVQILSLTRDVHFLYIPSFFSQLVVLFNLI